MVKTSSKTNQRSTHSEASSSKRGFAAMPHEKVEEIAHKGSQARAEQLGHEGYVELGRKGGEARAESHSQSDRSHTSKNNTDRKEEHTGRDND